MVEMHDKITQNKVGCVTMSDHEWDKLLQIKTAGRDEAAADAYHHPYEPTPYCVLERLIESGLIDKQDVILDYGCGKGRADFFLSYRTNAKTIGIEYDSRIYASALENQKVAVSKAKADFVLSKAEEYEVPAEVNRCYFFNPFSVEILCKVIAKVIQSYYEHPREIFLFFYYPADEYIAHLMAMDELEFFDEIQCNDLFPGKDCREQIMVFRLPELL